MIRLFAIVILTLFAMPAMAQFPPNRAPAVGVQPVAAQPVRPSSEFIGRVQATDRVAIVARVTAFIEQRFFSEGAEVKQGDLLYRLEQGPFQADLAAKQSAIDQFQAQLVNANVTLQRAQALLRTPAGQQSNVDAALATQLSTKAQLEGAQAQLRQSQINLDYTEIRSPIAGKIGRTSQTIGNVVSPTTGVLATIVSQDPMYVVFPVPTRTALEMRDRFAKTGGFEAAAVHIRLPGGKTYAQTGKIDFIDNTVSNGTDTIALRAVVPNPPVGDSANGTPQRELVDNEIATVVIEDPAPVDALVVPRSSVLTDQQGDYVFVVGQQNVAQQRRITLGQSTPTVAVVQQGLTAGEIVIVDGVQRVRAGQAVSPAPAAPPPTPPTVR